MSELLTNVSVGNRYTTGATLGPALDVEQLVFQVFSEPVYAQFFTLDNDPTSRQAPVLDPTEYYFPVGTLLSVANCGGARFRNAISGSPATINAWIGFKGDPLFDFQSSGLFSAAVLTLSFLHNNALVGAESALDFEDTAGELVWSVVDTPGTKEAVSLSFTNPAGFPGNVTSPGDFISGTSPLAIGGGPGSQLHSTGTVASGTSAATGAALTATVVGDATDFRFKVLVTGELRWSSGALAFDTTLARLAASVLGTGSGDSLTTNALSTFTFGQQGVALQAVGTVWAAAAAAVNNTFVSSVTGDTERRLGIQADGSLVWGSGSAATDVKLARVVNSPTGTGSFLELTAGAGFGYGVGTGGVIASIVSGSTGTLNKPSGKFTGSAAIATGAFGTYTVNNTCVGVDDLIVVNLVSGGGNIQRALVTAVAAGSFTVLYENASGVNQTPTINFCVIKGAQS